MYNVFLDTNIYRSLGIRFAKHRDYEYLNKFLSLGGSELGIIKTVEQEIIDYYKKDVFGKLFADYQRSVRNINDNHYLAKLPEVDFTNFEEDAFRKLSLDMATHMELEVETVPTQLLTEFLLDNKVERRGDNARDFLIFYSLMSTCKDSLDESFILISKDKIFQENSFFKEQLKLNSIDNLSVYESIPAFLAFAGPKVEWLTNELILENIDPSVIEEELLNDITCLPGYISKYYLERDGSDIPGIEKLTIEDYEILDFYLHAQPTSGQLKVNVDVSVSILALFEVSPDPESLRKFLEKNPIKTISTPEKFDNQGRLIYDEDVLFLFEGTLDEENKVIRDFHFVDFFPSYFRYDNFQLGTGFDLLPLDPYRAGS